MKQFRTYRFYVRIDSPCLYLRLNLGAANSKKGMSTQLRIDGCSFDEDKQRFVGSGEVVNHKNSIVGRMITTITTHKGNNDSLVKTIQLIGSEQVAANDRLSNSFSLLLALQENLKIKANKKKKISPARLKGMESIINSLSPFLIKNKLDLDAYDLNEFEDKKDRQRKLLFINKYFEDLQHWLIGQNLAPSTQKQYLSFVSESVKIASKRYGYLIPFDFDEIDVVSSDPIAMNPTQALMFINDEVEFNEPTLDYVYTIAKLQILAPFLRIMDALTMKEEYFEPIPSKGIVAVSRMSSKASKRGIGYIPISIYEKILQHSFLPPFKNVSKSSWTSRYNNALKEVLSFFPEIYNAKVPVIRQEPNGRVIETHEKLGDNFTSHNLVKTGINYWQYILKNKGVLNIDSIMDTLTAKTSKVRNKHYSNPSLNTDFDKITSVVGEIMGN